MTTFERSFGDVGHGESFLPGEHGGVGSTATIPVGVRTDWPEEWLEERASLRREEIRFRTLRQAVRRLTKQELPGGQHAERYLRHLYRHNSQPNTIRSRETQVRLFLLFLRRLGKKGVEEITRADLEAFIEAQQDRGLAPSTVNLSLVAMYAFLHFANEEGLVPSDLLLRKVRVRLPDFLPRAMDPDDVRRLLSVIRTPRDRAMILVLLRTGMRIGELLRTEVRDLQLGDRKILIFEGEKNCVGRVVYLSDDALAALLVWLIKRDPEKRLLFYGAGRKYLSYSGARSMFVRHLKAARLSHKGYSLHCLRHTFATELLNAGMRLECLQQLLGHSDLHATRRYARLTDKTREEEYFRAMSIIEGKNYDDHDQLDCELPAISEEEESLSPHSEELSEQGQAFRGLGGYPD